MGRFDIHPEISRAGTLPAIFYQDEDLFKELKEKIFAASWQLVGDTTFKEKNTVTPIQLLDGFLPEPLLLSNTGEKVICLSNVCTHRGNILVTEPGKLDQIICRYHGRRFDLQGNFQMMPEFKKVENFPESCDNLATVSLKQWYQFYFVSLAPLIDFHSISNALDERVGFLPIDKFLFDEKRSKDYHVNAHWALYCDNYLEGFHIPFVHQDLNQSISYPQYETVLYDYCNIQIGIAEEGTQCFDIPTDHIDYGSRVAAYYVWIFPNMMFNFYPWGLSINIVKPIDLQTTKVSFLSYVWDESKIENSAGAMLDKVEMEDEEVVENVQKGLKSRFYEKGRFSPTMEKGVHHFHRLLSEFVS